MSGRIIKTVSLTPEFNKLIEDFKISPSEAIRVGISMILAERGVQEYDNKLNIMRKFRKYQELVQNLSQDLEQIKTRVGAEYGVLC